MKSMVLVLGWLVSLTAFASQEPVSWVKVERYRFEKTGQVRVLSVRPVNAPVEQIQILSSFPSRIAEGNGVDAELASRAPLFETVLTPATVVLLAAGEDAATLEFPLGSEVRTLVSQGPSQNRIDLTILGDGYTENEKARFFEDAQRISDDLFLGDTFSSFLPLFNVHAVFVASKESGLTDGNSKRSTAFGLYRYPAGSKRAIFPGNENAIRAALRMAPDTDYSIVMANDDYYGGLGGEFAITTRSVRSGKIVLRHELGHNFGAVGEEYDGGQVYTGANFSGTKSVKWPQWFNPKDADGPVFESTQLSGDYVWSNLKSGSYLGKFKIGSAKSTPGFMLSSVGWETPEDVYVFLDGQRVEIKGDFTSDRSFFEVALNQSLAPGSHTLEIRENIKDGNNVLAFAVVHEYAEGYSFQPNRIGAFAVHDGPESRVGYRPTHSGCLMRDMMLSHFCSVDQENIWLRFLGTVTLLDDLKVDARQVTLLAPLLKDLDILWYETDENGKGEVERKDLRGMRTWMPEAGDLGHSFKVRTVLRSPEVRVKSSKLEAARVFKLPGGLR